MADISKSKADNVVNNIDDVCELTDNGIQFLVDALKWGGASFHGAGWNPRHIDCLLYTSPSPRDVVPSRMPSSA